MRKAFTETMLAKFRSDKRIAILLGDIGVYGFREAFDEDPNRCINVGIMEQSMVGIACGLAKEGYIPFIHTIAPFIVERAYEQIKLNCSYENVNVNIVTCGASYDYSKLGVTHQCPNDLKLLNSLPNFTLYCPGNAGEIESIIESQVENRSPSYIRLSDYENDLEFNSFGKGKTYRVIRANGPNLVILVGNAIKQIEGYSKSLDNISLIYTNVISNESLINLSSYIKSWVKPPEKVIVVEPSTNSGFIDKLKNLIGNHPQYHHIGIENGFNNYCGDYEHVSRLIKMDDNSILSCTSEYIEKT